MALAAPKLMTFEEFAALNDEGRYELVNGRLEELPVSTPRHSWSEGKIQVMLDPYLEEHEPDAFWGVELDIPTLPYYGRRPDFAYYSAAHCRDRIDWGANRVLGVPTLVAEVLSEDDPGRDLVVKRREYAQVGVEHYWILDPRRKTVLALRSRNGVYETVGEFAGDDVMTSELFPGLEIPLRRLFR